ncbi:PrsW family intramembrane metalloprotease [Mesoflavibacter sp. SCSIO 43206]|uniref:PrsW family intramembrane metalloprotease n=1 Tax=Mesoflavibacter sp. SCSIO 43206 TaxID=2779362 RepID=UPI001CA970C1|nr:PrsW family glutamic-type intramembrane protease [Mesoflavibacter sp. SCSIO 43206]UAB74970.1 PrsW family intramembrane metalloprotease [Mesoflavibacter sp. SCSIO 43206]
MYLLLSAIAPVFIIIIYIYVKDKYEKEPTKLLVISFLLGAIVSVIITTIFYMFFNSFLPLQDKLSVWEQFKQAFFVVGFSEELSKYLIVLLFAQRHKEFNEPFDGIVYAVMVSMGFAATENIMYVLQHGASTALLRAFTAVPAHATFGILMGYFMGMAKFKPNKLFLNLCGLLLAIVFHGAYDFFLFINFIPGIWVGAFVSLALGLFLSRKAIKRHQKGSFFKN